MNAGCFNSEVKDVFYSADILVDGKIKTYYKNDIEFNYRKTSIVNSTLILSATFQLKHGTAEEVENSKKMIAEMQQKRKENQIVGATCGSTFKNVKRLKENGADGEVETISVWKLLDEVGMRGYKIGGAMFSEKHCNFIINTGGATANDIIQLIQTAKQRVKDKFGINIVEEVVII